MTARLQHKTALVTAAGNGMGKAAALAFAEQGAQVWACDIDAAGLDRLQHPNIHCRVLDVCDGAGIAALVAEVAAGLNPILAEAAATPARIRTWRWRRPLRRG